MRISLAKCDRRRIFIGCVLNVRSTDTGSCRVTYFDHSRSGVWRHEDSTSSFVRSVFVQLEEKLKGCWKVLMRNTMGCCTWDCSTCVRCAVVVVRDIDAFFPLHCKSKAPCELRRPSQRIRRLRHTSSWARVTRMRCDYSSSGAIQHAVSVALILKFACFFWRQYNRLQFRKIEILKLES